MYYESLRNLQFAEAVSRYTWDVRNYSRYLKETSLVVWPDQSDIKKNKKRISFGDLKITNKKEKGFELNMLSFEKACFYNVSMVETALIKF